MKVYRLICSLGPNSTRERISIPESKCCNGYASAGEYQARPINDTRSLLAEIEHLISAEESEEEEA
jgi:hypothetical protein